MDDGLRDGGESGGAADAWGIGERLLATRMIGRQEAGKRLGVVGRNEGGVGSGA